MMLPKDLLIFLPWESLSTLCSKTCAKQIIAWIIQEGRVNIRWSQISKARDEENLVSRFVGRWFQVPRIRKITHLSFQMRFLGLSQIKWILECRQRGDKEKLGHRLDWCPVIYSMLLWVLSRIKILIIQGLNATEPEKKAVDGSTCVPSSPCEQPRRTWCHWQSPGDWLGGNETGPQSGGKNQLSLINAHHFKWRLTELPLLANQIWRRERGLMRTTCPEHPHLDKTQNFM